MRTCLLAICALALVAGPALAGPPSELAASSDEAAEKAEATQDAMKHAEEGKVLVLVDTTMGDFVLELDQEKAPISVENFLAYIDKKAYDGTIFHRVIDGFMIQGGGFDADMKKRATDEPIKNEWKNGLKNEKYTIAMARLGNQADSATNQFFINVNDNSFLDQPRDGAGYAVFGHVVQGKDVVDAIKGVKTAKVGMYSDVPVEPVVIESIRTIDQLPPSDDAG
ncbi:MAG: peptidylprolyl isomerase [Candidatus Eiseniibacteriota bacterium]|jgi:cyclophilin family peptidyl-prolyl cis-trans isomerase